MSNNSSFGVGFWLFMVLAVAIFIGSVLSSDTSVEQYAPEIDDTKYAPPVKAKPKPKRKPKPRRTTSAPSPLRSYLLKQKELSRHWNWVIQDGRDYTSNGYTWTRATDEQKKWICDKMDNNHDPHTIVQIISLEAGVLRTEKDPYTSSYFMNYFNNFYGSTMIDSTSMDDASKLHVVETLRTSMNDIYFKAIGRYAENADFGKWRK